MSRNCDVVGLHESIEKSSSVRGCESKYQRWYYGNGGLNVILCERMWVEIICHWLRKWRLRSSSVRGCESKWIPPSALGDSNGCHPLWEDVSRNRRIHVGRYGRIWSSSVRGCESKSKCQDLYSRRLSSSSVRGCESKSMENNQEYLAEESSSVRGCESKYW